MKKVIVILTALLLGSAASAQDYQKNIFGIRAGLNLASISVSAGRLSASTDSRAAYHIAVTDQILLCNKLPFYLETGLGFSSRGGKVEGTTVRSSYLQVPVLLNYHIDIRNTVSIQPFAGLYYGLGIGGKGEQADGVKVDVFSDEGGFKRSDFGVRLGAGIAWGHLYFGLGYEIGCLNTVKSNDLLDAADIKMRNNCFTLSIGYNF